MEKEQHEMYEYARKRIVQKKGLYFHFVLFLLGSLFLAICNHFDAFGLTTNWSVWVIVSWFFVLIFHFIKVFIADRFMNKNWERDQIERLIALQQKKISQLELKVEESAEKPK